MRMCHKIVFWLALPAAAQTYVGSAACAKCHAGLYADYQKTAMGRATLPASETRGLVSESAPVAIEKDGVRFEVARHGEDLYQTESLTDASGAPVFTASHKLEYAIGSGLNGISYAVRRGGYLFQAPLSYYSRAQRWQLSPGYENGNPGFNRALPVGCMQCHTGRPRAVPDREGLYAEPPFGELSIGCENCHGPGSFHVSQPARANIVNPARLAPRRADDICMNCHQAGDTRVYQPGKTYADFRPGQPLSSTVAIFKIPLDPASATPNDLLEHHFSMQLSKCFQGSKGRMTCLSCHDPHAIPPKAQAAAYYERKCLACHTVQHGLHETSGCIGCHMPKNDIGFISHSALTNHRIVARPGEPLPGIAFKQTTPDLNDLIYLNRADAKPIAPIVLLQGYGELESRAPQYRARYLELLDRLTASLPENPSVQAAAGRKLVHDLSPEAKRSGASHLSKAIQLGFTGPAAFEDLAFALAGEGKTEQAVGVLKQGLELNPYAPRLHKLLTVQYINLQQYDLAKASMQRYLELFPEDNFVRDLLRKAGP